MSNRSHLIAKRVADKRGFVKTVYVRPEPDNGFRMPRSVMSSHSDAEVAGVHWEDARNPRIAALVKKQKRGNDRLDASFEVVISNKSGTVILGAQRYMDKDFTGDDISDYIAENVNELGWLVTVDFAHNALAEFGVPVDMEKLEEIDRIVPKA